jgi:hypothetical protein
VLRVICVQTPNNNKNESRVRRNEIDTMPLNCVIAKAKPPRDQILLLKIIAGKNPIFFGRFKEARKMIFS